MTPDFARRCAHATVSFALTALATATSVHAQQANHILYVDAAALPGGDGSDWLHAYRDLQDALALVPSNPGGTTLDRYDIRIAQGIYRPDRGTLDRDASFVLNSAATLRGGFGGLLSPYPDLQDASFISVLSGDLSRDDGPNLSNMDDNSRHVVTLRGAAPLPGQSPVVYPNQLQDLIISGGNVSDGSGAAISCPSAAFVGIINCIVRNNRASFGAAVQIQNAFKSVISNTIISDNLATQGVAGVQLGRSQCRIYQSHFLRNRSTGGAGGLAGEWIEMTNSTVADNSGANGGGMELDGYARISATRVVGNTASISGGGFYQNGSDCTLTSCLIAHNMAPVGAGAAIQSGPLSLRNCTLTRNSAANYGGAVWCVNNLSPVTVMNSILWANTAFRSPAIDGPAFVHHSILQSGQSGSPAATLGPVVLSADPAFVNPTGSSPSPLSWLDKDYHLTAASPAIDRGADLPHDVYENSYYNSIDGNRFVNNTCAAYSILDLGTYEFQAYTCQYPVATTYVRANAPAGGDGRSWQTALRDLQDALATPGVTNVWIAEGTYHPDRGTFEPTARFWIQKPGVHLYGGFAGTETSLSQRTIREHPTILSADLLENDSTSPVSTLENSSCLVSVDFNYVSYPASTPITLSGLTFRGVRAGPAAQQNDTALSLINAASATVTDCTFIDNHNLITAPSFGMKAGALLATGPLNLVNCRFMGNSCASGGGAISFGSSLQASDCEFSSNAALSGGAIAGGDYSANVSLTRCSFVGNAAIGAGRVSGGAVVIAGNLMLDSCRFLGNIAYTSGESSTDSPSAVGGALVLQSYFSGTAVFSNSLFAGNRCAGPNSADAAISQVDSLALINCTIADNASGPTLGSTSTRPALSPRSGSYQNCIFWNSPAFGPTNSGPAAPWFAIPSFQYCLIQTEPPNTALATRTLDPRFRNPPGPDGIIGTADDDYSLQPDSPAIDAASATFLPTGTSLDLLGHPRFYDAPLIANTGSGTPNFLDIGAIEFDGRACPADFNASGSLSAQDIFDFLSAWFTSSPAADFNHSGTLTPQDIFDFLTAWFAGC